MPSQRHKCTVSGRPFAEMSSVWLNAPDHPLPNEQWLWKSQKNLDIKKKTDKIWHVSKSAIFT
jgi:hypothetical protein